jgi:hypothetical protein
VLETGRKELEKDVALRSQVQLGLAHRTVSGAPGWSAWKGRSRDSTAAYDYNSPDRPVSHPRRTRRPWEKQRGDVAIIHQTVRSSTGLSGEPTVASANGRPHNIRATRGLLQRSAGAPDCPVCTEQCPVRQSAQRSNCRICQIWKEIKHRTVYRTCPVRHSKEDKDSLPCWSSTAPSCLGL